MKKIVGILTLIPLILGVWYVSHMNSVSVEPQVDNTHEETQVLSATPSPFDGIASTPAFSGEQVSLVPNFKEQKTSEEIQSTLGCEYLVNAGFYTKENTPVGLFKSNGVTLRAEHESELFDGFLTINAFDVPRITKVVPADTLRIAIQVGPLLIENKAVHKLTIRDDKLARRMVAAVTGDNEVMFIVVKSAYLAKLPTIINDWAHETNVNIADAVNLDGGSASAFRSPTLTLPEITPIGSAFCIK